MRVRARLQTDGSSSGAPADDPSLLVLAHLFPFDPFVDIDDEAGWLSASTIDAADADPTIEAPELWQVAEAALGAANGAAQLLAGDGVFRAPALAPFQDWTGVTARPSRWRISEIRGSVLDIPSLHVLGAQALVNAAADPSVARVLRLLTHGRHDDDLLFDLWKATEVIGDDLRSRGITPKAWTFSHSSQVDYERFMDAANNVAISGKFARHEKVETARHPAAPMGRPEAQEYVRRLAAAWLEEREQITLRLA